jgi:hypothetical protein
MPDGRFAVVFADSVGACKGVGEQIIRKSVIRWGPGVGGPLPNAALSAFAVSARNNSTLSAVIILLPRR